MDKKKYIGAKLICDDIIPVVPMAFEFIPPPGMRVRGFWPNPIVIIKDKSKILKVKEWLERKRMPLTVTFNEVDNSNWPLASSEMLSRYAQKTINQNYYGVIGISSRKLENGK